MTADVFRRPGNPNDMRRIVKRLTEGKQVIYANYSFYTLASVVKVCNEIYGFFFPFVIFSVSRLTFILVDCFFSCKFLVLCGQYLEKSWSTSVGSTEEMDFIDLLKFQEWRQGKSFFSNSSTIGDVLIPVTQSGSLKLPNSLPQGASWRRRYNSCQFLFTGSVKCAQALRHSWIMLLWSQYWFFYATWQTFWFSNRGQLNDL